MFFKRKAHIVTMHGKEQVIAPVLLEAFDITSSVFQEIDTDQFGTFSGEVERKGSQMETVREKQSKAFEHFCDDLIISSEGSFNPHPEYPFLTLNIELVLLTDRKNDLQICGKSITTESNFDRIVISNIDEIDEFLERVGFPEHRLIVSSLEALNQGGKIFKGINNKPQLLEAISEVLESSATGKVVVETDMRAMHNPTRMKNIKLATLDLVKKMSSQCPNCQTPGFEVVHTIKGLPCEWCHTPTRLKKAEIWECKACEHSEEIIPKELPEYADPGNCDLCNP